MRNFNISLQILHICPASIATQHPRWHKSITLQEDKPSLRVTSGDVRSALLRKQSDFAEFDVPSGQEIAVFHEIPSSRVDSL